MSTTTLSLQTTQAGRTAKFADGLSWLARACFGPHDAQAQRAESVLRLLARADSYAETQPSYAADLRSAALSHLRAD